MYGAAGYRGARLAGRDLQEYPYVLLDTRHEKVRHTAKVIEIAVLLAPGSIRRGVATC